MIDIHCHIVSGLDDGSKSLEQSIEMAKIASNDGIRKIINTSHYHLDSKFVVGKEIEEKVNNFNNILKEQGIDLEILIGNELYYTNELMNRIDELDFYSLNKSKYILIEFSPSNFPDNIEDIIYEFKIRNYIPILAHVERYEKIVKDPNKIYEYIKAGALIQINSNSITGKSGKEIQNICNILIRNNMVHFVATDAHSSNSRKPVLNNSYKYVEDKLGKQKAKEIFYDNPQKLISDEHILIKEPIRYKQNKFKNLIKNIFKKSS